MSQRHLSCSMTRAETVFGWIYLLLMQFIPIPMVILLDIMGIRLSSTWLNILFFTFNFLVIAVVFHRYLAGCLRTFTRNFWHTILISTAGFAVYWSLNMVISLAIALTWPDFANANDANIRSMSRDHYWALFAATVFLVPITEETLFRGVMFGSLHKVHPILAYIVSALIFSAIHVVPYIGTEGFTATFALVSLLQYLPPSVCLAWVYEKSNTIIAPTLVHTAVNLIGMMAMR